MASVKPIGLGYTDAEQKVPAGHPRMVRYGITDGPHEWDFIGSRQPKVFMSVFISLSSHNESSYLKDIKGYLS